MMAFDKVKHIFQRQSNSLDSLLKAVQSRQVKTIRRIVEHFQGVDLAN